MSTNWDWMDNHEKKVAEERSKDYFNIVEGKQQFMLLSHIAPLAQIFDPKTKKYRVAVEGDKGMSIKGVCWVYQDGLIKSAKLPYTIVKQIRALAEDSEWDFKIPFNHPLTLTATNAGSKEVEYSLNPSPKTAEIPQDILDELAKKPTPEEIIEKIKGKTDEQKVTSYPEEELNPDDIPF